MSWDADKKYIEQLEQDNAKLQKIVDAGVEIAPVKILMQKHSYSGYIFNVIVEKNGQEIPVSKFSTTGLDVDDVICVLESIGHCVKKERSEDVIPKVTVKLDKFKKKMPILSFFLWPFTKPWSITESAYDIILAIICNCVGAALCLLVIWSILHGF
jgi:hypothetical protein